MPAPILLDLSHTSHTRARTGIQRVARSLRSALGPRALGITHDPYRGDWRRLKSWETAQLDPHAGTAAGSRGARWPLSAKLAGTLHRLLHARRDPVSQLSTLNSQLRPSPSALLVPEVFSPTVAAALPALFTAVGGPRVAVFHDALALQLPELTPRKTVARFPSYLQELLAFDGIAAVSADSAGALTDYWHWLGVTNPPPVATIPLGIDAPRAFGSQLSTLNSQPPPQPPTLLCVSSLEGRKNHVALLDACAQLWSEGAEFRLHLIGLAHPETGRTALERIRALQAAGRAVRYDGPVSDAEMEAAFARCAFTVYPSLREGFGLPVLESLSRGKPCICSGRGALGESARGGGAVLLERVDVPTLHDAIGELLAAPTRITELAAAARQRKFRTWPEYADDVLAWMTQLGRQLPRLESSVL